MGHQCNQSPGLTRASWSTSSGIGFHFQKKPDLCTGRLSGKVAIPVFTPTRKIPCGTLSSILTHWGRLVTIFHACKTNEKYSSAIFRQVSLKRYIFHSTQKLISFRHQQLLSLYNVQISISFNFLIIYDIRAVLKR